MLKVRALEVLVHEFSRLPGIGPKTAQRLTYFVLRTQDDYSERLREALLKVKLEVHLCPRCYNYTDMDICHFCQDPHRSNETLCVVEEPSDISRIEASGAFRGRYHVLHGAISPLDGIGPAELKIHELVLRIDHAKEEGLPIQEVILALDADLEGDTTVLYLTKILHPKGIRITRIAHGVPIGSDIDFVDDRTMGRALENRISL